MTIRFAVLVVMAATSATGAGCAANIKASIETVCIQNCRKNYLDQLQARECVSRCNQR